MAADVLALLSQLPATTGLARGRLLGRAVQELRDLSLEEQRTLVAAVAQRFAPELADRLPDEGPLGSEHLKAIVEAVAQRDPDDLVDLAARLSDPDELGVLLAAPPLPPEPPTEPAGVHDEPAQPPAATTEDQTAAEPDVPAEPPADTTTTEDEPPELAPTPVASAAPAVHRFTHAEDEQPDVVGAPQPRELVARLRRATTANDRLSLLRRLGDLAWQLDAAGRRDLIRAVPDGWQRRRAVADLVRRDLVPMEEIAGLVTLIGTPRDRGWLGRSLHADGTLDDDDLLKITA